MSTTGTNDGYSVTVTITSASWSGRTLNYGATLYANSGSTSYGGLNTSGSMSGTGSGGTSIGGQTSLGANSSVAFMQMYGSVGADAAGNVSVSVSGSFGTQYPFYYGGYQVGMSAVEASDSASWHISTPPNTPTITSITRATSSSVSINYSQAGGGPACTYYLERATNAGMTTGFETTTANPAATAYVWATTSTTNYYFRARSTNSDGTTYSAVLGPYYGQPSAPASVVASTDAGTAIDRVKLVIGAATGGNGTLTYNITRNGSPTNTFTTTSLTYYDVGPEKLPGNAYTYTISATSPTYSGGAAYTGNSITSNSINNPGPPEVPVSAPAVSNVGLDYTVVSAVTSTEAGVPIVSSNANEGYFVQYQTSTTGVIGSYGAWSTPVKMTTQATRTHTYISMAPALYYSFRTYAANSVVNSVGNQSAAGSQAYYPHQNTTLYTANYSAASAGTFLSAGGRRWAGSYWIPTAIAKRYSGTAWVPLTIAKRYNGTAWVNLK